MTTTNNTIQSPTSQHQQQQPTTQKQSNFHTFATFYNSLPQQPNIIRFFTRSSNPTRYSAHADNALYIVNNILHDNNRIKYGGNIPYILLNNTDELNNIVVRLLSNSDNYVLEIELYSRDDTATDDWTVRRQGNSCDWGSFNTLKLVDTSIEQDTVNDNMIQHNSNNTAVMYDQPMDIKINDTTSLHSVDSKQFFNLNIPPKTTSIDMSICVSTRSSQHNIGVAIYDGSKKLISCVQFIDTDKFNNIKSFLSSREQLSSNINVVYDSHSKSSILLSRIRHIVESFDTKATDYQIKNATLDDIQKVLKSLCSNAAQHIYTLDKKYVMYAVYCLIDRCDLKQYLQSYCLKLYTINWRAYVKLDDSAKEALNLFKNNQNRSMNRTANDTLFGLLNHVKYKQAQELLTQWINQPLTDIEQIERRHNYVEMLMIDSSIRTELMQSFKGIPDINKNIHELLSRRGNLNNVVALYQVVNIKLPQLYKILKSYRGKHKDVLENEFSSKIQELMHIFAKYIRMYIHHCHIPYVYDVQFLSVLTLYCVSVTSNIAIVLCRNGTSLDRRCR